MKASMKMAMLQFCSTRMVMDYDRRFYRSAADNANRLCADNGAEARLLAGQHWRLKERWEHLRVEQPVRSQKKNYRVGDTFDLTTQVHLADL